MDRRLTALFATALVGVVVVVGLALSALGSLALVVYLLLLTAGLSLLVRRQRALQPPTGRTCTCCTSTVRDPVTVVDRVVP
ncbi:MAG TPA: hypothetical protein VM097_05090 [Mycobacteriales bacterium]|nr:hypothetical protein [Mycobacteriales bacterium]